MYFSIDYGTVIKLRKVHISAAKKCMFLQTSALTMAANQLMLLLGIFAATCYCQELILEDNFDTFNLSLWRHQLTLGGGGNFEFQYYTNNRTNSYVEDGVLYLRPTLLADDIGQNNVENGFTLSIWGNTVPDRCTGNAWYGCSRTSGAGGNILNPIKSASVWTVESFYFQYGRVEVRAKLPKGDWLWPAIWLLPRWNNYGGWPASGEMDIMESRGNAPDYPGGGRNRYGSALHWGPSWQANSFDKTHDVFTYDGDLSDDYHVYGFIWNETYIGTYLDTEDQVVFSHSIDQAFWDLGDYENTTWTNPWQGRGNNAPFDSEFYLIMNVAIGGTNSYFPDGYGKPWNNSDPNAINKFWAARDEWYPTWIQPMAIDSVKVWSANSQASAVGNGYKVRISLNLLLFFVGIIFFL